MSKTDISPSNDLVAVTPADDADLAVKPTRGLYVGVAGDVKVSTAKGQTVVLANLAAGMVHPIAVVRVWAADTDATNIVAVY